MSHRIAKGRQDVSDEIKVAIIRPDDEWIRGNKSASSLNEICETVQSDGGLTRSWSPGDEEW